MTDADVRQAAAHVQLQIPLVNKIQSLIGKLSFLSDILCSGVHMLPVTTCKIETSSLFSWPAGERTGMKGSRRDKSLEGQMSSLIMLPKLVFSPVLTAMTRHSSSASCTFHTCVV